MNESKFKIGDEVISMANLDMVLAEKGGDMDYMKKSTTVKTIRQLSADDFTYYLVNETERSENVLVPIREAKKYLLQRAITILVRVSELQ